VGEDHLSISSPASLGRIKEGQIPPLNPLPQSGRGGYGWIFSQAGGRDKDGFSAKWKGK